MAPESFLASTLKKEDLNQIYQILRLGRAEWYLCVL